MSAGNVFHVLVFLIVIGASALAQPTKSDSLKILSERIEILADQLENMQNNNLQPAETEVASYGLGPSASQVYHSTNPFSIAGYGEMVYENFSRENDAGTANGKSDRLDFLRNIIYFGYHFNSRILFNSEIEYEHASTGMGGEVSVEFAYLDFALSRQWSVRTGMLLIPVGIINEFHEPPTYLSSARPLVERYIIPTTWRANGIGILSRPADSWELKLYLSEGMRAEKWSGDSGLRGGRQKGAKSIAESFAVSGRVDYTSWSGNRIGFSFYRGNSGQGLNGTGGSDINAATTLFSLHTDMHWKQLHIRGLYAAAWVEDSAILNDVLGKSGKSAIAKKMSGFYVTAGLNVLPFFVQSEQSLSPYFHFETLDLQEEMPAGFRADPANRFQVVAAGLAFKPHPQIVFKWEFRNNRNDAGTATDQMNLTMGYMF